MSDAANSFTTIERAIVDWLEASGFKVTHTGAEWTCAGPKFPCFEQSISITALACAIYSAMESMQHSP